MYKEIVEEKAKLHFLPKSLVMGIIETESNFNPMAVRYEDAWKYLYSIELYAKKTNVTFSTEKTLQKCSWGLMQVMGSVLRELGFNGSFLELVDPNLSIEYGCRKLKSLVEKYSTLEGSIAAYNAGSPRRLADGSYFNQEYVDKVKNNFKKYEREWL